MAEPSVLGADEVLRLLPGALDRPAPEGARLVALRYLHQLMQARTDWLAFSAPDADGGTMPARRVEVLHRARVALRRLRATLREHERVLDGVVEARTARALRALGRATNAQRDADVHLDWLAAQAEHLPAAARVEADELRARLGRDSDAPSSAIEVAFAKHLDPVVDGLLLRLGRYTLPHRVGHDPAPVPFGRHLAARLARGGARLRRDLSAVRSVADQEALHHVRIRLKRQRALVAPFTRSHPALGAWFERATRGQDLLGAMRDTHLLALRARKAKLHALAAALQHTVLGQYAAFERDWLDATDEALRSLEQAAAVVVQPSGPMRADGVPMEIERKYLLHACPPEAERVPPDRIEQGWLPGESLRERLRRRTAPDGTVRCYRTVKLGPAEARLEVEEATSTELFEAMWPLTHRQRVRKRRHVVREGDHRWEIDVFLDRDLVLAEIELASLDERVTIPDWLAPYVVRDVTGEPAYFNAVLARAES